MADSGVVVYFLGDVFHRSFDKCKWCADLMCNSGKEINLGSINLSFFFLPCSLNKKPDQVDGSCKNCTNVKQVCPPASPHRWQNTNDHCCFGPRPLLIESGPHPECISAG